MDERIKSIGRILDGEKMAALCREFNISRKTSYKIIKRYNECGLEALTVRSRQLFPQIHCPAISTEHTVLDRHGLVKRESRSRRDKRAGTPQTNRRSHLARKLHGL